MKDHRQNARTHDVRRHGSSPSSEKASTVVRGGHPALDRALARAAARNVAQPPVSALRAACLTTFGTHVATTDEMPAHAGRPIDGTCMTSDRDNVATRVMHVATVRDVPARGGWYRVRTWHELTTVSPN